jgi:WD40 repeat protein
MSTIKYHTNLACYFTGKPLYLDEPTQKKPNTRKLVEQPWQQTKAELWDEVTETLCNLDFIQAKAAAKLTYELVDDYSSALLKIPDNEQNILKEIARHKRMDKYAQDLISYAKDEIAELDLPISIIPGTQKQTHDVIEQILTNPTKADKLKDFQSFVGQELGNLQKYADEFNHFTIQQAFNYADKGPVFYSIERVNIKTNYLLKIKENYLPSWCPESQVIRKFKVHSNYIFSLAVTPNWQKAISSSFQDGNYLLWDIKSGRQIGEFKSNNLSISRIDISADGKTAASCALLIGSSAYEGMKSEFTFWDLESSKKTYSFIHNLGSATIKISPTGENIVFGDEHARCFILNAISHKSLFIQNHQDGIVAVDCTPNFKRIASASGDATAIIWDVNPDNYNWFKDHSKNLNPQDKISSTRSDIGLTNCFLLHGHTKVVNAIAMTPDGKKAITASFDKTIIIWDLNRMEKLKQFEVDDITNDVAITPDGKLAISATGNLCFLWDLSTWSKIKTLTGHGGIVNTVKISSDGNWAMSASNDRTCILWNLNGTDPIKNNDVNYRVIALAVTSDNKFAVSGSNKNTCIIWDVETGRSLYTFNEHQLLPKISMNGNILGGSGNGNKSIGEFTLEHQLDIMSHNYEIVTSVEFTPDNKLVLSGSDDKTCILWNLRSKKVIHKLYGHTDRISALAITPNGKFAVSASYDKSIILWDLIIGKDLKSLQGHSKSIVSVAISKDGKFSLTGDKAGNCMMFNLFEGKSIKSFNKHTDQVISISISPDGKFALSSSFDKTCILWDLRSGLPDKIFKKSEILSFLHFSPDGKKIISASNDLTFEIWDLSEGTSKAIFTASSQITSVSPLKNGFYLGLLHGEPLFLDFDIAKICNNLSLTTIRQIWDFALSNFSKPKSDCPLCSYRFEPPKTFLKTIIDILYENNIQPNQSPCLKLPYEAWEHPGLLSECPSCHEKLKFNPFFGSDQKGIEEYLLELEKDREWDIVFENAEKAFKEQIWEEAFKLYLKLISAEKFDASYMRYNMAICRINTLTTNNQEIIGNINVLIRLLQEKGENDRVRTIEEKLIERLDLIKEAKNPWWKKLF